MRPAYVRVELGDPEDRKAYSFVISPVPFVWLYGDTLIPTKSEQRKATSYAELCTILANDVHIPKTLLPPEKYFKPTRAEKQEECWDVHRTVPEGTGEPAWRRDARHALIVLLEEAQFSSEKGVVSINDRHCYSLEELQQELEAVAEQAGGRKKIKGRAYQFDYDVLVKEILKGYADLLAHVELPRKRRKAN